MKSRFEIDQSEKGEYPLGAWATRNGMHFSFAHPGESCVLVLYRSGGKTPLGETAVSPGAAHGGRVERGGGRGFRRS